MAKKTRSSAAELPLSKRQKVEDARVHNGLQPDAQHVVDNVTAEGAFGSSAIVAKRGDGGVAVDDRDDHDSVNRQQQSAGDHSTLDVPEVPHARENVGVAPTVDRLGTPTTTPPSSAAITVPELSNTSDVQDDFAEPKETRTIGLRTLVQGVHFDVAPLPLDLMYRTHDALSASFTSPTSAHPSTFNSDAHAHIDAVIEPERTATALSDHVPTAASVAVLNPKDAIAQRLSTSQSTAVVHDTTGRAVTQTGDIQTNVAPLASHQLLPRAGTERELVLLEAARSAVLANAAPVTLRNTSVVHFTQPSSVSPSAKITAEGVQSATHVVHNVPGAAIAQHAAFAQGLLAGQDAEGKVRGGPAVPGVVPTTAHPAVGTPLPVDIRTPVNAIVGNIPATIPAGLFDDIDYVPDAIRQRILDISAHADPTAGIYSVSRVPASADWGRGRMEKFLVVNGRPVMMWITGRVRTTWFYDFEGQPHTRVNLGVTPALLSDKDAVDRLFARARPRSTPATNTVYASRMQTVRERGERAPAARPFEEAYDATGTLREKSAMPRLNAADIFDDDIVVVECHFTRWRKNVDGKKKNWTTWDVGFELVSVSTLYRNPDVSDTPPEVAGPTVTYAF